MTVLATLYTEVVEIREPNTPTEGGQFEAEVEVDLAQMRASRDPKRYFFRKIGMMLGQAILSTTVPKQFWWCEFTPEAQKMFNLPERQKMEI